jgi:hypothetical protein
VCQLTESIETSIHFIGEPQASTTSLEGNNHSYIPQTDMACKAFRVS